MRSFVLPDVLAPSLNVVFCGSAVGSVSARRGAYYAGPGNRFWPMLFEIRLTPRLFAPGEFRSVRAFGIGLTDMNKTQSGADASLAAIADDATGLARKITRFSPRILAFNGKRAGDAFLADRFGEKSCGYGRQPHMLSETSIHVLPSTSGAARRWWDEEPWYALAAELRCG